MMSHWSRYPIKSRMEGKSHRALRHVPTRIRHEPILNRTTLLAGETEKFIDTNRIVNAEYIGINQESYIFLCIFIRG